MLILIEMNEKDFSEIKKTNTIKHHLNKVDFAIRNGKPYKQNVAFLCNRERECNKSINCGKECHHTFDVEHAINFLITENAAGEKYFVEKGR